MKNPTMQDALKFARRPGAKLMGIPTGQRPVMLTLPYPPSLNRMYRAVNGRSILSAEGREYKSRVKSLALLARPLDGPVSVSAWLYRPAKRGDLDNSFKALLDALKGVAFHDDAQVQQIHAVRYDDKDNPRAEVAVSAVIAADDAASRLDPP